MGFVNAMAEWVAVPHEPGAEFRLRPLSGAEVELAETPVSARSTEALKAVAGIDPQILKEWRTEMPDDPTRGLDSTVVVQIGLLAWRGGAYSDIPCDDAHKALLDAMTRDWAAQWVANRSRRPQGEGSDSSKPSVRAKSHSN